MPFTHPLMENNITREDLDTLIEFLKGDPRLTQAGNVKAFEEEWSRWLGVERSLYINSGASANLLTMAAIRHLRGPGEVIVPTLTWVSDIASVLHTGMTPVFVDIDPRNLCMAVDQVLAKLTPRTKAVFLTYVQGFNGLSDKLLQGLEQAGVPLIEDVCESHGATFKGRKLGSFGLASNFSFYFAHHMSTIEGGMVCTSDMEFYETLRMLRSHGMTREAERPETRERWAQAHPSLSPDFIFAYPAWNMRGTEIGGVLGRSQLKRLDGNNIRRTENLRLWLSLLDPAKYRTDFDLEGCSNYAFNLILAKPDTGFRDRLEAAMDAAGIEYRRGSSGGGNQLRQPYLRGVVPDGEWEKYPEIEHVHFFGYYIGNWPSLAEDRIRWLASVLNAVE